MSFKNTELWRAAFNNKRADATPEEQARLAGYYESMRTRASALVAKIAGDLPHMTIHDVTHLDALWEMASIASGKDFTLNPAEAFVFGGAILLHDAAMTLAAYPGGIAQLRQQTEWRDLHASYLASVTTCDPAAAQEAENRATADALRLLHARQAQNLPMISWMGPHKQEMFIIEDQQVRNFYGQKIGKAAYSHWWDLSKVEEELSGTLGALPDITNCTVDLLKVACLLRIADAMHLDQRRAPAFEFALVQPKGVSAEHWKFQERMGKPFVKDDALVYTAQPPFEVNDADAWWSAFDALQILDRELRDVDRVLREHRKMSLMVQRVDGAHSPTDLARTVETVGWTPVNSTVRVSDVPNIIATLGGSKLYGDGAAPPVRELIQNGLDAIIARRRLQGRPSKWGELKIALEKRQDGFWLCFEDNGVGMSSLVLTGPLIDFGNSFWRSSLAIQEFPGLVSSGMKARGKYGIGFFSIFMLGSRVRVITRRFDRDMQSGKVLEFHHGLGSRPNLRNADPKEVPVDGGTRVEVRLNNNPVEPKGLLYRENFFNKTRVLKLSEMIAAIAPACDVAITVEQEDENATGTGAGDWLEIGSSKLLERITADIGDELFFLSKDDLISKKDDVWQKLTEIRDEDGRIYGRARIDAAKKWSPCGLMTVDGLAACRIRFISGILIGVETTASRNSAIPIVPASVLASWSSEQAIALSKADVPDAEKAMAAAVILACGGNPEELPIVWWKDNWMTVEQFTAAAKMTDRLALHRGSIDHEDDDDVSKRSFEAYFKANVNIAHTVDGLRSGLRPNDWITPVMQGSGASPIKIIENIISSAWGDYDEEDETLMVGQVNDVEIYRTVSVFLRSIK